METWFIHVDKAKQEALLKHAEMGSGLIAALAKDAISPHYRRKPGVLLEELYKIHGKPVGQLTVREFLSPQLTEAFAALAGREMANQLPQLVALRMEGQFSSSPGRRSYRSKAFTFYWEDLLLLLRGLIRQTCHIESLTQKLYIKDHLLIEYPYQLALEIRRGNEEIISLFREAIMGDNSKITLTRNVIDAIVISGHPGLQDDLLKLLLAARLQDGLRQQILEASDRGSVDFLIRVIKLCLDEDLLRYSGTIRAFDVWTGMGYGDSKPAAIKKYAQIAYDCLTDDDKRKMYYESENNVEAYFAFWAQGCHEFEGTCNEVPQLLEDPRHYRQVLGWLFVTRTDNRLYQMRLACRYVTERDEELLAWIVQNLAVTYTLLTTSWRISRNRKRQCVPNPNLPDTKEARVKLFHQLKDVAEYIGNRKRTFTGNPFDFVCVTLSAQRVYDCMISLTGYDLDEGLIGELLELAPKMSADQRMILICSFLLPDTNASHRAYLQNCLSDRSILVKELAVERLADCKLAASDLDLLAAALRSKSSDLRSAILQVFKKQPIELISPLIPQMLQAADENQVQAAIELISELKNQHPEAVSNNLHLLSTLGQRKISSQTQILLDQLLPQNTDETTLTLENGFGLYDPKVVAAYLSSLEAPAKTPGFLSRITGTGELYTPKQLKGMYPSWKELDKLMERIDQVFDRHANAEFEVEWSHGARENILFGDHRHSVWLPANCGFNRLQDPGARLDMVPFWEEFRDAFGEYAWDVKKMLGLRHLMLGHYDIPRASSRFKIAPWYKRIAALDLPPAVPEKYRAKGMYAWELLGHLPELFDSHAVCQEALRIYRSLVAILGEENLAGQYVEVSKDYPYHYGSSLTAHMQTINCKMLVGCRNVMRHLKLNETDFAAWFTLESRLEMNIKANVIDGLTTEDYFRACSENLIPQDVLVEYLTDEYRGMPEKIRILTNPNRWPQGRQIYELYPFARELVNRVVHRAVDVEEKRGELRTPMTSHCLALDRFEGAKHFCGLLTALGKESFFRGYEYSLNDTKKAVLSRLLKRCYPGKEDTPESLAALLKTTDISDKRLAEAMMYAPQWASFAEQILDWPGLKCGVWFFHAHINESFSAEKETEVAIYSPISPQQFNDGAFDKNWFFEAYNQLGEKRFQILYKAAKYITSGSNQHRRSQLYSDAVLGKLDVAELMQEIRDKRNQEKLRCYPLIPIAEGDKQEALRRYAFIQQFLKESKQFGAQRRDSEKKACATALENLAITTGLMDVNRLMWQMEGQKIQEIRPLMEPVSLEGLTLRLTVDENGDAGIAIEKGGKALKTLPKALSKNEVYLELKNAAKELKELKRRSRDSLERAMTEGTEFGAEELRNICSNPVLAPMLHALVWTDGASCGFLEDGIFPDGGALRIAHPHDMKQSGTWASFMHLVYDKKLVQPFKQVFREYYPITADELQERTISRRYAGHQVQPQRTVALLKGRGWTVDYEEGLQKVFYKEDLIVRMFAMADWFSPADIEAPTLETVEFFNRRTGQNVPLAEVPPILFSETMRDLDLVVSVAHVGGVDPEASHSTVQMRAAIAAELTKLLRISNVFWVGSHAKIRGSLGSYSVHMGSGVVHMEGVGMVSILPVHAQARGRVFLPFADDDPKTAEIMSKILLLAEDHKIKDPTILNQLSNDGAAGTVFYQ